MATAIIVDTLVKAIALRDAIGTRMGLPRAGVDIGDGIHAPATVSRTTLATRFIRHPDGSARWAVLIPPRIAIWLDANTSAQIVTLTADWFPVDPNV